MIRTVASWIFALTAVALASSRVNADDYWRRAEYAYTHAYATVAPIYRPNPYADYLRAVGELQLNEAKAAEHIENARSHALDNDVKEVESYYQARLKNRHYRRILNPSQSVRQMRQKMLMQYRVTQLTQAVLSQDQLAEEMNWMAGEVYRLRLTNQEAGRLVVLGEAPVGLLQPTQLNHLRLTDQPGRGREGLIWRANDPLLLNVRWPYLFQKPEFEQARREFETQRAVALDDINKTGGVLFPQQFALRMSVDYLDSMFTEHYTRRLHIPYAVNEDEFQRGQEFVRDLKRQSARLLHTEDAQVFDGRYVFEGETTSELVDHLGQHGLGFAEALDGDEGTYRYVFQQLLNLYQQYQHHNGPNQIIDPTAPAQPHIQHVARHSS